MPAPISETAGRPPQNQRRSSPSHANSMLEIPPPFCRRAAPDPFYFWISLGILVCFFLRAQGKGLMAARRPNLPEDSSGLDSRPAAPPPVRFASSHPFLSFPQKNVFILFLL
jgi:hypothetical protein